MPERDGAGYRAFISYSHDDEKAVARLHRDLERYRVPARLVGRTTEFGEVPARLTPIFRDQEELPASSDLSAELIAALRRSDFLIVVCSPGAARSRWVAREIEAFRAAHGPERILAVIAAGKPNASASDAAEECFPAALRFLDDGQPTDHIAADLRRPAGRRLALIKLAAGGVAATAVAAGLLLYADAQRTAAEAQRLRAEEERGRQLFNTGAMFVDMGDLVNSEKNLREALAITRHVSDRDRRAALVWYQLARSAQALKNLPLAEQRIGEAEEIAAKLPDRLFFADVLSLRGQILQEAGQPAKSERTLRSAVTTYNAELPRARKDLELYRERVAITEVFLALAISDQERFEEAFAMLDQARRNYDLAYHGKLHPNHGDLLVYRARILARAGRMDEARPTCASGVKLLRDAQAVSDLPKQYLAAFIDETTAVCGRLRPGR